MKNPGSPRVNAGVLLTALLCLFFSSHVSHALVPPREADTPLPKVAQQAVRDDRAGAYTARRPLQNVADQNRATRSTAGSPTWQVLAGTFSYPVLLGKYTDTGADPFPAADLEAQLFQDAYSAGGRPGSLRDYYEEVSYAQLVLSGTVFDWQAVGQNAAYYQGAPGCSGLCVSTTDSAAGFVNDLLAAHDAAVDFSLFDNDGPDGVANSGDDDGVVDLLVVVQAGPGGECGGPEIWSHLGRYSDAFGGEYSTNDAAVGGGNIRIEDFIIAPSAECDASSRIEIGVFAYLFGSHFGLPALWDRDGSSRGAGIWDLMGRGLWGADGSSAQMPLHPSAYSKNVLGWLDPTAVTAYEADMIPAIEGTPYAREWRRAAACAPEEYFLTANRQPMGFDADIPGNGLMIWHVDESVDSVDDESRPLLMLLPEDAGYPQLNDRADGDADDPWPDDPGFFLSVWADDTDPSSRRHGNRSSGARMDEISPSADPIFADVDQDAGPLAAITAVDVDDTSPGNGDQDGVIDPYETVRLGVHLSGEAQSQLTGVTGTLVLDPPVAGVTITNDTATWPDLDLCGLDSVGDFEISLDASVDCETELNFRLDLSTDQGALSLPFSLFVGGWNAGAESNITASANDAGGPRATADSGGFGVVYHQENGGNDFLRLARLSSDGTILGDSLLSSSTGNARRGDIAWSGSEYGVAWQDDRDGNEEIYFVRVDSGGNPIGAEVRLTNDTAASLRPRIAWNDANSEWGIVWHDERNGPGDIFFARVDAAGAKVGGDVGVANGTSRQVAPDIEWNGSRYGVSWQEDSSGEWSVYFAPLDATGSLQAAAVRLESLPGDSVDPAVSWNDSSGRFGVAYRDYADGKDRASLKILDIDEGAGSPSAPALVSADALRVSAPALDSDDLVFFVSWIDWRQGARSLRMSRIGSGLAVEIDGAIVDANALHATTASLASGGGRTLATWNRESASTRRFDILARVSYGRLACGRDDDGDGVNQPADNCPQTVNPDQADADGDEWGDACDCDDVDPAINPGTPETICDGIDNDCSALTPDAPDQDGDGWDLCDVGDINNPDGKGVDCDDNNAVNYPGNTEVCDGSDNDCDSSVDEGFATQLWYRDADVDGYGDPNDSIDTCDGNNQGYVADNTDCDDTRSDVFPGALEICDSVDNDCDGTTDNYVGDRHVAVDGSDSGSHCTDPAAPCATITYAASLACTGETILVAEGSYVEDVLLDRPVIVDGAGDVANTFLSGTGSTEIVRIFSSDVTWDGIQVQDNPGHACLRIGSAAFPDLRNVFVKNTVISRCRQGVLVDRLAGTGSTNRIIAATVQEMISDGTPDSGVGILITGGAVKFQIANGTVRDNDAAGIRVLPAPEGKVNDQLSFGGLRIFGNGRAAPAGDGIGIDVRSATEVSLEGNNIYGSGDPLDGSGDPAVLLEDVAGGSVTCTRIHDNGRGIVLSGTTEGIPILNNRVFANFRGIVIESTTGPGIEVHETLFTGNQTAIDYAVDGTLDASRCWWGAADGPAPGGSGDGNSGNVDTSNFIARAQEPLLVRRPESVSFSASTAACYPFLQQGIDAASGGELLLVGAGTYREHVTVDKALEIEGVSGAGSCSPVEIDGRQSGGSHLPAFSITGVDGFRLRDVSLVSTGEGSTVCGENTGDEIGLKLDNVVNSIFEDICLKENGVTEVGIFGNSDNNTFRRLTIDGLIRDMAGVDACGHRSREAFLIDGGAACEGGAGAIAEGNIITDSTIDNVVYGVDMHLADGTTISNSTFTIGYAPAWDGGNFAVGINLSICNDTTISNNTIGGALDEGIKVAGKANGSCVSEGSDSNNTTIRDNIIRDAVDRGINIHKLGPDPGAPTGVMIECNDIRDNGIGAFVRWVGTGSQTANEIHLNDIFGNSTGVRNVAAQTLDATENWWGDASGPSGSGPGSGDRVLGSVTFNPWLSASSDADNDLDGYSRCAGDCDDGNDQISPDAVEVCDMIDNDCDGSVDEGVASVWYRDLDGDTYGNPDDVIENCDAVAPNGYVAQGGDCNDNDDQIHPGASEICDDNQDNDCDGSIDAAGGVCADLEVTALVFSAGRNDRLTWNAATSASSYALYRGDLRAKEKTFDSHRCLAGEIAGTSADDARLPLPGEAFYYLAMGLDTGGGGFTTGALGTRSDGSTRADASSLTCGPRIYVDASATGSANGSSWADAYTSLSAAFAHAVAPERSLEIWLAGNQSDPGLSIDGATRRGVRILGGFSGSETSSWQRDPIVNPSTWSGDPGGILLSLNDADVEIDGLTLSTATRAIDGVVSARRLLLVDADIEAVSDRGVNLAIDTPTQARIDLSDVRFDSASLQPLTIVAQRGTVRGRIAFGTFAGAAGDLLTLEANPTLGDASIGIEILANRLDDGENGIVLRSSVDDLPYVADLRSFVASNILSGNRADGILVEAVGNFTLENGASVIHSSPDIIGNTIEASGGAGIRTAARRTDGTADPSVHDVGATPSIWNNLITNAGGSSIEESADDPASNLNADPLVVGNDLFGSTSLYLDEGVSTLNAIADVNALSGNSDNYSEDPLYSNAPNGDYHLSPGSPAIDRGNTAAPRTAPVDFDGASRVLDGDADGRARIDTGADETTP